MTYFTILHIPTSGDVPCEFKNVQDDDHNLYDFLRKQSDWQVEGVSTCGAWVSYHNYKFHSVDGRHLNYEVYFCGEALDLNLQPNHRATAMASMGMYGKNGNPDEKSRQYELKNAWGCNFFYGDIFIRIKKNQPLPDATIYGENPLAFMVAHATEMGREFAPVTKAWKRKHQDWFPRANLGMMKPMGQTQWERHDYKFFGQKNVTQEFKDTLLGWMEECGCFRMELIREDIKVTA